MKPRRLQQGNTIGIVSPSWFGGAFLQHRVERGVQKLESLGFRVKIAPHALNNLGYVSDTPENRVSDIHEMFSHPDVRAIIAMIGGNHSCQLLPLLDWELIRSHPKIFMGFSDVTVLNVAIWKQTGLVTFNGPTLLTEWAEYPKMPDYTEEYVLRALCKPEPIGRIVPAKVWTDEFLDWSTKQDLIRARLHHPSQGWTWLKDGYAEGVLVGGCLESLQHLRGTPYWPDWKGAVLFLETSEEKPTPATVDAMLMDYENMGVLRQICGLLFARPYGYSEAERQLLHRVIRERTKAYDFPIIADMDFGHTSPIFTLPIGCRAIIDTENLRFAIDEVAVC